MKLPSSSSLLLATLAVTASSSSLSALAAPAGDTGDSSSSTTNPAAPCPSDGAMSRQVGTSVHSISRNIRLLFSVFLTTQPTDQQPQGRAFMPSFAYVAQDGARRVAARDDFGPDAANGNPSVPGSPAATPSTSAPLPTPTPESRDVKPPVNPPVPLPVSPPSPPVEPPVKPPVDKVPAKPAN